MIDLTVYNYRKQQRGETEFREASLLCNKLVLQREKVWGRNVRENEQIQ